MATRKTNGVLWTPEPAPSVHRIRGAFMARRQESRARIAARTPEGAAYFAAQAARLTR